MHTKLIDSLTQFEFLIENEQLAKEYNIESIINNTLAKDSVN